MTRTNAPATTKHPSPSLVRAELERLKISRAFTGSDRLYALLSFIVDETSGGPQGTPWKESGIGNEIYGRKPGYDPRIDSAVRVEAKRLRRKLDEYYADEGSEAGIRIEMPRQAITRSRSAGTCPACISAGNGRPRARPSSRKGTARQSRSCRFAHCRGSRPTKVLPTD